MQLRHGKRLLEFIDVPGHDELITNMINGTSYANTAVLMVSAKENEGISAQTRRHAFLAYMLGIRNFVVAVNKMDEAGYERRVFYNLSEQMRKFFGNVSRDVVVRFIPISAYMSQNLTARSNRMSWYHGLPLLDVVSEMNDMTLKGDNELRVEIQGKMKYEEKTFLLGRILDGTLYRNEKVKILPFEEYSTVTKIVSGTAEISCARLGKNIALELKNDDKKYSAQSGMVLYRSDTNIDSVTTLYAEIFILGRIPEKVSVVINNRKIEGRVKIEQFVKPETGKISEKKTYQTRIAAYAEIRLSGGICAEPFAKIRDLGRFMIYDKGKFSGMGIVKAVM